MKDSGIGWIGEIPSDWDVSKIKYHCSMQSGDNITASDIEPEGEYKVYGANGFRGFYNQYNCEGTRILVGRQGALAGNVHIVSGKYWATDHAVITKITDNTIDNFLYYALVSANLNQYAFETAAQPGLAVSVIINKFIPFPPLVEQKKIADFLDEKCGEIDSIKADVQRQIELLNDYKKSVITEAVTKGLNPKAKLKDSCVKWIGKIPEHWKVEKGKYLLQYMQKPVRADDGVITCFRDGEVTLRSNRREDGFTMADKEIGYQGIDVGDLVVHGMDGFAGSIGISDSRGKASPVLNVLDSKQNKRFLMYYLRSMAYSNVFVAIATGIRVRSCDLRWNKLAELLYPVPSLDEQNEIVRYIDSTLSQTDQIIADKQKQLETLDEYKKSLIFEYVTGKKEVVQ